MRAFMAFPKDRELVKELCASLYSHKKYGFNIYYSFDESKFIELYIEKFGGIRKEYDFTDCPERFQLNFYEGDSYDKGIRTEPLTEKEANNMCKIIVPFFLSDGKKRDKVPLLINDFPEFANFALRYEQSFL